MTCERHFAAYVGKLMGPRPTEFKEEVLKRLLNGRFAFVDAG